MEEEEAIGGLRLIRGIDARLNQSHDLIGPYLPIVVICSAWPCAPSFLFNKLGKKQKDPHPHTILRLLDKATRYKTGCLRLLIKDYRTSTLRLKTFDPWSWFFNAEHTAYTMIDEPHARSKGEVFAICVSVSRAERTFSIHMLLGRVS